MGNIAIRFANASVATTALATYTNATDATVTAQWALLKAGSAGSDGVLNGITASAGQLYGTSGDPAVFNPDGTLTTHNLQDSFSYNPSAVTAIIDRAGVNKAIVGRSGSLHTTDGGVSTVTIAVNTSGNTVVKASPGRLCKVLVVTAAASAVVIYDNATGVTGTVIGTIAANAAAGTLASFQMPAANGITVAGASTLPAITISFA